MGIKIKHLIFILMFVLGFSVSATETEEIGVQIAQIPQVKIAIGDNGFKQYNYKEIVLSATDEFFVFEKDNPSYIARIPKEKTLKIEIKSGKFEIKTDGEKKIKDISRSLQIACPKGVIGVENLKRKGKQALYHGIFEIVPKNNETFFLINELDVETYLKGVVPNEMPVKFGLEALKAQAVAARNYVLSPRAKTFKVFDVYDSVASQVYYGANTEELLANRAIEETKGLVALYNWDLILAQYSSTAGGYTESYENVFSDPKTKEFPSKSKPYLIGKPDMLYMGTLETEEEAQKFYMEFPESYDVKSPYYRWQKTWGTGEIGEYELENILKKTLSAQAKTGFVKKHVSTNEDFGILQEIKIKKRGVSGKIMELEIITDKQTFTVQKELVIRRVFQKNDISLPSANVVFVPTKDENDKLLQITAYGGGFGHGVGMSQYGAGYMGAVLDRTFDQILKRYYSGISIGTQPIILSAHSSQNKITQAFWLTKKKAVLIVDNRYNVSGLKLTINGKDVMLEFKKHVLPAEKVVKMDISEYLKKGENLITFQFPEGESDKKALRLYVETSGANDDIIF